MTVASVIDLPPIFDGIEAVCFDVFSTLVEIIDRHAPFVPLFRALPPEKRPELKHRLMREAQAIDDWPALLGVEVDLLTMFDVGARVMAEVYSDAIRPGAGDLRPCAGRP